MKIFFIILTCTALSACEVTTPSNAEMKKIETDISSRLIPSTCKTERAASEAINTTIRLISDKHARFLEKINVAIINENCFPVPIISALPANTIAIDETTEKKILGLDDQEYSAIICHEMAHIILSHWRRRIAEEWKSISINLKVDDDILSKILMPSSKDLTTAISAYIYTRTSNTNFTDAMKIANAQGNGQREINIKALSDVNANFENPLNMNGFPMYFEKEADIEAMRCMKSIGYDVETYRNLREIAAKIGFEIPEDRTDHVKKWIEKNNN